MAKSLAPRHGGPLWTAASAFIYGLIYLAVSLLNGALSREPSGTVFMWFPAGVALAGFVIAKMGAWPFLLAVQAAADLAFGAISGRPPALSAVYAASNALEALVGAFLVLKFAKGPAAFDKLSSSIVFIVSAALVGPAVGASAALSGMIALGIADGHAVAWLSFFGMNAVGAASASLALLVWTVPGRPPVRKIGLPASLELATLGAGLLAAAWIGYASPMSANPAFRYLVLPFILWAGLRFSLRVVSLAYLALLALVGASLLFVQQAGPAPAIPAVGQIFFIVALLFGMLPCVVIAGLRESDRSLRESEAEANRLRILYQDLLETSQDLIWQCDASGRFAYLNSAWERVLGYAHDEMIGRKYYDFLSPELVSGLKAETLALQAGEILMARELRLLRKDGASVQLMCNIKAYADGQGALGGARGTAYDVTERRRMEETIYNAQKQESLGVLAGGLAHDFNNLLAGIFGFVDLAISAKDPEKARSYLLRSLAPFERAKDLTRQLLTFSKGGAPAKRRGSVAEVLRESVEFALSGRNVHASFKPFGEIPDFSFDRNQIGQVVQNIVINACEAMPEGGEIEVALDAVALGPEESQPLPPGDFARIAISDRGPGIPADILPRVFDPFFTTKAKGSGLGLAICYSIVAKHHGSIRAESEPGKGTRFVILLPILREKDSGAAKEAPADRPAALPFRASGRALVMDDEGFMRELGTELLGGMGYEVLVAEDGEIALSIFSRAMEEGRPISLALLDLTVPGGMSGRETAEELRKAYGGSVCIIAVSGYAEDPIMADADAFGFDGALPKPYKAGDLAKLLSEKASSPR